MLNLLQAAALGDIGPGKLPVRMVSSDATAFRLVKLDAFGADLIRFPAGGRVPDHTHIGDHILDVLSGRGWVDYDGTPWALEPGVIYLIPGMVRHGIRAESELTLLAIANDHRDPASPERLNVVAKPSAHTGRSIPVGGTGASRPFTWRANVDDGKG